MPNESWYVLVGGQQYGPYPLAAMEQFVAEGRVTPQTMLRQGETGAWAPAGQMLDFSRLPASASGSPPGGFPPSGPIGYAPPPRSTRSTWVIPVVVGGVCLALFVMCLGLPMLFFFFRVSAANHEFKREFEKRRQQLEAQQVRVEELRKETEQVEKETKKARKDFENKRKEIDAKREEIEAKARSPLDEPAVKPDGTKTPVEAEPEPRSP
jgi:cell division protein FtsB